MLALEVALLKFLLHECKLISTLKVFIIFSMYYLQLKTNILTANTDTCDTSRHKFVF